MTLYLKLEYLKRKGDSELTIPKQLNIYLIIIVINNNNNKYYMVILKTKIFVRNYKYK